MHLRLLRLFLGFAAVAWGISVVGVFLSWSAANEALQGLGARPIAYDPMLDYWLRMAAGAFALLGGWYFVLMIWPQRFHAAVPWFGGLMLVEGVSLLVHGLRLALPPLPFYGDVSARLVGGGAILYLSRYAKPEPQKRVARPVSIMKRTPPRIFFFRDWVVGQFALGVFPAQNGEVRYQVFRGPGHSQLTRELKANGGADCYFKRDEERVVFRVIACPRYGVLTVTGLSNENHAA